MGLDSVELVVALEVELGISIPNVVAASFRSPLDAVVGIESILLASGSQINREELERIVKGVTLGISGVREAEYNPSKEFVRYFGLD